MINTHNIPAELAAAEPKGPLGGKWALLDREVWEKRVEIFQGTGTLVSYKEALAALRTVVNPE